MSALSRRRRGRALFVISGIFLGLFVVNMGLRIAHIKFAADVFRFDDVGEFLLVLLCMAFFVAGLLRLEQDRDAPAAHNREIKGGTT